MRGEDGFTLVELLVGMSVLLVVMLATLQVLDDSTRLANRDNDRVMAMREAQVGMDKLVRELRHTREVVSATPQVLTVRVLRRSDATPRQVVFDCSVPHPSAAGLRRCTRASGGATELLVDRVRPIDGDTSAFTYTPAAGPARHVTVRLGVAVDGGRAGGFGESFVLTSGTGLRNAP